MILTYYNDREFLNILKYSKQTSMNLQMWKEMKIMQMKKTIDDFSLIWRDRAYNIHRIKQENVIS